MPFAWWVRVGDWSRVGRFNSYCESNKEYWWHMWSELQSTGDACMCTRLHFQGQYSNLRDISASHMRWTAIGVNRWHPIYIWWFILALAVHLSTRVIRGRVDYGSFVSHVFAFRTDLFIVCWECRNVCFSFLQLLAFWRVSSSMVAQQIRCFSIFFIASQCLLAVVFPKLLCCLPVYALWPSWFLLVASCNCLPWLCSPVQKGRVFPVHDPNLLPVAFLLLGCR